MYTVTGLRFLRALAKKGDAVPAYLLDRSTEPRGARHLNQPTPGARRSETAHARHIPR
jgi:hypothetical protein